MNWSLSDNTEAPNVEAIYKQMCGRNGLDVAFVSNSGNDERHGIVVVERNEMGENSAVDCKESGAERNESDVNRSVSNVDHNGVLTSDVAHSIFQIATLAGKRFPQHFQTGRKLNVTPATLALVGKIT